MKVFTASKLKSRSIQGFKPRTNFHDITKLEPALLYKYIHEFQKPPRRTCEALVETKFFIPTRWPAQPLVTAEIEGHLLFLSEQSELSLVLPSVHSIHPASVASERFRRRTARYSTGDLLVQPLNVTAAD